ncbi:MAG TPA: prepilin-type N-terminal cleavage/methylation domain-containing protein [Candidatus Saccharimonadales bacterium]|nr:prepilin-type N-terminal cleavage/methylation domain-containing protein [Candidatus Saccharimonadales bacterium]
MFSKLKDKRGFTIVELLIVIIVIGILATLVITTYNGVQSKARDTKRKTDLNSIQGQVEAYNAQNGYYPTNANMNTASFVSGQLKGLDPTALQDPQWKSGNTNCTTSGVVQLQNSTTPASGCYGYTVSPTGCDNSATMCASYTLVANLEAGGTYQKTGSD